MLDPTICSGRDAVHLLGVCADEFLAAAGHDIRAESVGAQQVHHLPHRLIDQLGVFPLEAWVPRRFQPFRDDVKERLVAHAGVRDADDLRPVLLGQMRYLHRIA